MVVYRRSASPPIGATVAGIALSAIGRGFGASLTAPQRVVTMYTLPLPGCVCRGPWVTGYGRKRIILTDAVWIGAAGTALCIPILLRRDVRKVILGHLVQQPA